ncbi:DNA excision repair protein ERCC-1, partial [Rhincodon typus]|uniref:DNA excision repair protein ERCC-1 n=1 Tax=Rhincodon typus TaxID=259920 RepID=UPI00202EEC57
MDDGQETPGSFAIPPLEQIDGPEPSRVEPLFRARGGRSEARGEGSGPVVREGPGTSEGPLGEPSSSKAAPKQNSIVVSPRQRGNPILKFIRNVSWEFGDVVPDYILGQTTCALYLSLRYHSLNRDYIHHRLRGLGQAYALRVLLVHVDT